MATETSSLFRVRVPAARLRKAEEILGRLGMKPGDAFNMLLAQIELQQGLPFPVELPKDDDLLVSTRMRQSALDSVYDD